MKEDVTSSLRIYKEILYENRDNYNTKKASQRKFAEMPSTH